MLKSYQWSFVKFSIKMLIYIKHNIKMNLTAGTIYSLLHIL